MDGFYSIPRNWKKRDLLWAMFHARNVENYLALIGDYDKILTYGLEHVRKVYGFNIDYTKYSKSADFDLL